MSRREVTQSCLRTICRVWRKRYRPKVAEDSRVTILLHRYCSCHLSTWGGYPCTRLHRRVSPKFHAPGRVWWGCCIQFRQPSRVGARLSFGAISSFVVGGWRGNDSEFLRWRSCPGTVVMSKVGVVHLLMEGGECMSDAGIRRLPRLSHC